MGSRFEPVLKPGLDVPDVFIYFQRFSLECRTKLQSHSWFADFAAKLDGTEVHVYIPKARHVLTTNA
jgi:hypothetical protein